MRLANISKNLTIENVQIMYNLFISDYGDLRYLFAIDFDRLVYP